MLLYPYDVLRMRDEVLYGGDKMADANAVNAEVDKLIEAYEKENGVIDPAKLADMKLKTFIPRAKNLLARAAKEANVKVLIDFAKKYASTDSEPDVLAAVAALTAVVKGTRTVLTKNGKATPRGVIAELFTTVGTTATESDIFAKFRMGRGEMKGAIKLALKSAAPADRKWVSFDVESEVYTLVAIGADAPAGWTGYLPLEKATEKAAETK